MKIQHQRKVLAFAVGGVLVGASLMIAPKASYAQDDAQCVCQAPMGTVGSIIDVSGNVMVSQLAGFGPGSPGNQISEGTRVVVGPNGSSRIALGSSCSASLSANTAAEVSAREGMLCLRVVDTRPVSQTANSQIRRFGLPAMMFTGLAAGGFIVGIASRESRVSR